MYGGSEAFAGGVMTLDVTFQPMLVETGTADEEGQLVHTNGRLVAVLIRLADPGHSPADRGKWQLEVGFGPCAVEAPDAFAALADAEAWVRRQFARPGWHGA